jgi:hypothetical protein
MIINNEWGSKKSKNTTTLYRIIKAFIDEQQFP